MASWLDFWNGSHAIYVSERHKQAHAAGLVDDYRQWVRSDSIVLDFGCGEALYAEQVAQSCQQLMLYDGAARVQDELGLRFADHQNCVVLDASRCRGLDAGTLDLVVVNSVLQYLSREEFVAWLRIWHRQLKNGGRLVLADIIKPETSALRDALALLRFAASAGFFLDAVVGLARTLLSDYGHIRRQVGLAKYNAAEISEILGEHGFNDVVEVSNFGHNQARFAVVGHACSPVVSKSC